jgi:branched-chain amino acid transport system ATP-binding protein
MLKTVSLRSGYGSLTVIDGISMHVDKGEVIALLGGNGAGKSTFLKTIAGLISPMEGRIFLNGQNITGWPAEKVAPARLSLVPEGRGLFPGMSVLDNIRMGGYAAKLSGRKLAGKIKQTFELFPVLTDRLSDKAGNLSGGQQQMLAIARALVGSPNILLLDEPSTGLAPILVAEVFEKINQLRSTGMTILVAEQNVQQALQTADRAYVIENGKVVLDGPASELMESEEVRKAYLGI